MAVLRRFAIPCLVAILLIAIAPAVLAGARVTEHYFAPSDSSRVSSGALGLEIGFGGAGGDLNGGPSAALALEVPVSRDVGVMIRSEFAAFEQDGQAFIFPVAAQTVLGVISVGARLNEDHGTARTFIEGGIGLGVIHSDLLAGPILASRDEARTCLSGGMGVSWQPGHWPVGIFGEARLLAFMARPRVVVFPTRAGITFRSRR